MAQGGRACVLFCARGTCEGTPSSPSSRQGLVGDDVLTASSEWTGLKDSSRELGQWSCAREGSMEAWI